MGAIRPNASIHVGLMLIGLMLADPTRAPAQPSAPKVLATFKRGWVVYTQGGKRDSLAFGSGQIDEPAPPMGNPGDREADVSSQRANGAVLEVGITTVSLPKSLPPDRPFVTLKLNGGPAGDSEGPDQATPCVSKFAKFDASGIDGSVTCTKFTTGPTITSVHLVVKP
jgi:hypothetical protein